MDQEVEIKEEPVQLERTASPSLDNYEHVPEITHLNEEPKSEVVETGQTFEPFTDVNNEIFTEENTAGQEEENVDNIAVLAKGPADIQDVDSGDDICSQALETQSGLICDLQTDTEEQPCCCSESDKEGQSHSSECISSFSRPPQLQKSEMLSNAITCLGDLISSKNTKLCVYCNDCGKMFSCKSDLRKHLVSHSDERPIVCDKCGSMFSRMNSLQSHMKTHTGERPHSCNLCARSFYDSSALKKHMLTHTGQRPHLCKECGSSFSQNSTLKKHMLTHTGERPHRCNECGKTFSMKATLKSHVLTHTGERPHVCQECGRAFSQKTPLKSHMLSHTSARPYKCGVCSSAFSIKSYLSRHMRIHSTSRQTK